MYVEGGGRLIIYNVNTDSVPKVNNQIHIEI